jgi:branched-chain amino acid transport system substrate-binding protein
MRIVNDNSDPGPVITNYTQLISRDHVNFTFRPSSSLLTAQARVAARYLHAFPRARVVGRRF